MKSKENVLILGAGLAGSLLAIMLARKGFQVKVIEKRADPRSSKMAEGRSINLALSHRGIRALKHAEVFDRIKDELILMKGRMMHTLKGELTFQPYGKDGQGIYSVSRNDLNKTLIDAAEETGVSFYFERKCIDVDLEQSTAIVETAKGYHESHTGDVLIGADGAFSVLRRRMMFLDRFNYQQMYIEHGYKELRMPSLNGDFAMEPNYLHIWPRGNFMLIALPNPDNSFTCTLFFPFEGPLSFSTLIDNQAVDSFFSEQFNDAKKLIPDFVDQFEQNPTSSLITIRCNPWSYGRNLLLGDSAHAIVPFYGQGMNAAFEDCRIFTDMGEEMDYDWDRLLSRFSSERKKDGDAIADLALRNFIEMRDQVADDAFLNRKKADAKMHERFGEEWTPLYTMVTFTDLPYHHARDHGYVQENVLKKAQDEDKLDDLDYIMRLLKSS